MEAVRRNLTPLFLMAATFGAPDVSPAADTTAKPALPSAVKVPVVDRLEAVWNRQYHEIQTRIRQLNERRMVLRDALEKKGLASSIDTFSKEWKTITDRMQGIAGVGCMELDWYAPAIRDLDALLSRWEQWDRVKIVPKNNDTGFAARIAVTMKERAALEKEHLTLILTGDDGHVLGLYPNEKKTDPNLTHTAYLDRLAATLKTPENLAMFLRYCTEYCYDSPDPSDPLRKGTDENHGEYWQTPGETLERVENEKMLNDCDDRCFLASEVLSRWGKKPIITTMPEHGTCVWIERDYRGKYHGWDIGTFGLDHNGARFGHSKVIGTTLGVKYLSGPPQAETGYDTAREAWNSVFQKFRDSPNLADAMKNWNPDTFSVATGKMIPQTNDLGETIGRTGELIEMPFSKLEHYVTERRSAIASAAPPPFSSSRRHTMP